MLMAITLRGLCQLGNALKLLAPEYLLPIARQYGYQEEGFAQGRFTIGSFERNNDHDIDVASMIIRTHRSSFLEILGTLETEHIPYFADRDIRPHQIC